MHQIRFPVLTVRETVQPARLPDVRDAALSEITRIAEDFQTPDDDVRPFLLLGNDEGVHSITPSFPEDVSLPFDEQLAMFIDQIGPMVLTQKEATCAAFVVTVWTAPGGARGHGPARQRPPRQAGGGDGDARRRPRDRGDLDRRRRPPPLQARDGGRVPRCSATASSRRSRRLSGAASSASASGAACAGRASRPGRPPRRGPC